MTTAYRLAIGPVPSALGPLYEILHIAPDGQVVRAAGDSLDDALARLNAEPKADTAWCAAPQLAALAGPGVGDAGGSPNHAQSAAALRHLVQLSAPDMELDCPQDKILHGLFAAFAALTTMRAFIQPGTSRPFHFQCEGIYEGAGHVILSAAEDALTCVTMGSEDDLRVIYEAGLTQQLKSLPILGTIGAIIGDEPTWLANAIAALTGQSFTADLFVWLRGERSPFGPKSALLLSILAAVWPAAWMNAGPTESELTLPAGRARISLTPVTL